MDSALSSLVSAAPWDYSTSIGSPFSASSLEVVVFTIAKKKGESGRCYKSDVVYAKTHTYRIQDDFKNGQICVFTPIFSFTTDILKLIYFLTAFIYELPVPEVLGPTISYNILFSFISPSLSLYLTYISILNI